MVDAVQLGRHVEVVPERQHPDPAADTGRQATPPEVRHLPRVTRLDTRADTKYTRS